MLHNAAVTNNDGSVRYTCGQVLLDPARPTEVMAQMSVPRPQPSTFEDQHGLVSNLTFVEGLGHVQDTWFGYDGQSESTLGLDTDRVGDRCGEPA